MSTPVYESSVEALENLDFEIQCEGIMLEDGSRLICNESADFILYYSCGCQSLKCMKCFKEIEKYIAYSNRIYKTPVGICLGCDKLRDDSKLIVRPI